MLHLLAQRPCGDECLVGNEIWNGLSECVESAALHSPRGGGDVSEDRGVAPVQLRAMTSKPAEMRDASAAMAVIAREIGCENAIAQRGGPKLTALVARRDRQGPV